MLPSLRAGCRISMLFRGFARQPTTFATGRLRQGYRALPVITEEPASFLNGQRVRKK
jgi:hypothetical protein